MSRSDTGSRLRIMSKRIWTERRVSLRRRAEIANHRPRDRFSRVRRASRSAEFYHARFAGYRAARSGPNVTVEHLPADLFVPPCSFSVSCASGDLLIHPPFKSSERGTLRATAGRTPALRGSGPSGGTRSALCHCSRYKDRSAAGGDQVRQDVHYRSRDRNRCSRRTGASEIACASLTKPAFTAVPVKPQCAPYRFKGPDV